MVIQGRQGLEHDLAQTLTTAATNFTATSADLVAAAALLEELLPALAAGQGPEGDSAGQSGGVASALQIFQHALEAVPEEVSIAAVSLVSIVAAASGVIQTSEICIFSMPSFVNVDGYQRLWLKHWVSASICCPTGLLKGCCVNTATSLC